MERAELALELLRVLAALPEVEMGRRRLGPRPLLVRLRRRARRAPRRSERGRARLRRAIAWLDARLPGGANCYRRVLLETALDRRAAAEVVRLGLSAAGGAGSGHAWLGGEPAGYDAVFSM